MDRKIFSRDMATGEPYTVLNPSLVYLDTSVWIDIYDAFEKDGIRIIDEIAAAIGDKEYRHLVSTINFFEQIKTSGDISKNFALERTRAFDSVRTISANQPTIITDQEVYRFLDQTRNDIYIFDPEQIAMLRLNEGVKRRQLGETDWFIEHRRHIDDIQERDYVRDLQADIWELSGVRPHSSSIILNVNKIKKSPLDEIIKRKPELIAKRQKHIKNIGKTIPTEKKFILDYALNRMTDNVCKRFGYENVSINSITDPKILIRRDCRMFFGINDMLLQGTKLTFEDVKNDMPGLYWQAKITYHNYYFGKRNAGGQAGDRNHAIYLPYSDYFATCDRKMIKAIQTEYPMIFKRDRIHLFKIK